MDYKVVANPLSGLMSILSIVGMWKIFEDRGEAGWKALIPFYSTWTFAKTCNDTGTAKKLIISIVTLILSTPLLIFALATESSALTLVSAALLCASAVFALIYSIKLNKHFDIANNGPSWMIIIWIFVPVVAVLFYAFVQNNYNIPGVTEAHNQDYTESYIQEEIQEQQEEQD